MCSLHIASARRPHHQGPVRLLTSHFLLPASPMPILPSQPQLSGILRDHCPGICSKWRLPAAPREGRSHPGEEWLEQPPLCKCLTMTRTPGTTAGGDQGKWKASELLPPGGWRLSPTLLAKSAASQCRPQQVDWTRTDCAVLPTWSLTLHSAAC